MSVIYFAIIILIIYFFVKQRNDKKSELEEARQMPMHREGHPRRDTVVTELIDWLSNIEKTDVIVFDTETNGLHPAFSSVLSVGAIRLSWDRSDILKEKARFERYYFPDEEYDSKAISINGLTEERIKELRGDADYPEHFVDDDGFKTFCQGARLFAGHNIAFDAGFIPFVKRKRMMDTITSNADVVCTQWMDKHSEWKWPSLAETAEFYGIAFFPNQAHSSMYDALVTAAILKEMLKRAKVKVSAQESVYN